VHWLSSDNKGDIRGIISAAHALNLDFVILSDHGNPHVAASKATAWYDKTLLIGGSELSLDSGHMASMGYEIPDYRFPPEPQEAINEVIGSGGICFLSHPFDTKIPWKDWDIQNFTGIEVLSLYNCATKASLIKMITFPVQYLVNSDYAYLKTIYYPSDELRKWDDLNKKGNYYAIYALDAHEKFRLGKQGYFTFPSYNSIFRIFTVYIKVGSRELDKDAFKASSQYFDSLKNGNYYNVIEALAPANGFENYFVQADGSRVEMGGFSTEPHGTLILKLPVNFSTDIIIKKDGAVFKSIPSNTKKQIELEIQKSGVYRAEVFISKSTFSTIPWIIANPIFIGVSYSSAAKSVEITPKELLVKQSGYFAVEKNEESEGFVEYTYAEDNILVTRFTFKLNQKNKENEFWTAIAKRADFNFSGYKGIVFDVRGNRKMHMWLELRTRNQNASENYYYHSFLVDKQWGSVHIPFTEFHTICGEKIKPELSNITSFFFSINNSLAPPAFSASAEFKNIGLY